MNKRLSQKIFFTLFRLISLMIVIVLFSILGFIIFNGAKSISWNFLTQMPTDGMTKGGIFPAIVGTLILVLGSMIFAFPVGVAAAIYMNEYVKEGPVKRFMRLMTSNC